MLRAQRGSLVLALSFALGATIAYPAMAASPDPVAPASPPVAAPSPAPGSATDPATLTWQRLPDDPSFAGPLVPRLTDVAGLADGSTVVVGARPAAVLTNKTDCARTPPSWVLPAQGTTWSEVGLDPRRRRRPLNVWNLSLARARQDWLR